MEFLFEVFAAMQSMCGTVLSLRKGQTEILPCPVNATVSLRTPMAISRRFSQNLLSYSIIYTELKKHSVMMPSGDSKNFYTRMK